jgi:hypothetical protein
VSQKQVNDKTILQQINRETAILNVVKPFSAFARLYSGFQYNRLCSLLELEPCTSSLCT